MHKQPPKVFQLLAKTHKLTIFLNAPHPTTIAALKTQALAALSQFSDEDDVPKASTIDDFEFCRATKSQGKIVAFDVLETKSTVRDTLNNWEVIYLRFRNESGKLQDVQVDELPSIDDEEPPSPVDVKGKRKAPPM